ncbi:MAG: hypothetical protein ACJ758_05085 [Actinomycetota bacterium]
MSRRTAVVACSFVLEHVPDLVRYGSKPHRESQRLPEIESALRSFDDALAYPPNQVFIGNAEPRDLWNVERPWWKHATPDANPAGPSGELMREEAFYDLLCEVDRFDLVRPGHEVRPGEIPLHLAGAPWGAFSSAHAEDESLSARVMLFYV